MTKYMPNNGFSQDPALRRAGVPQTPESAYENSGYDRGHLAPSRALSCCQETRPPRTSSEANCRR